MATAKIEQSSQQRFLRLYQTQAPYTGLRTQSSDKRSDNGKVEARHTMQLGSIDFEMVQDHLSDNGCYCVVPINPDGACHFAVIDADIYGDDQARKQMLETIYASGLPLVPVRSKSGGLQITAYFDPPVPAPLAQSRMTRIAGSLELDLSRVEIFPKQTELQNADNPMTADRVSPVVMPYNDLSGPMLSPTDEEMPLSVFLAAAEKATIDESRLRELTGSMDEIELPRSGRVHHLVDAEAYFGVSEGSRDMTLWALACQLRNSKLPEELAERIVLEAALSQKPPLPRAERIAKEKVQNAYASVNPGFDVEYTQLGFVDYFNEMYGTKVRYDHGRGRWFFWKEHYWQLDENAFVRRHMLHCIDVLSGELKGLNDQQISARKKFCKSLRTNANMKAMLEAAQSLLPISLTGHEWNKSEHLLACENGVIDLRSGKLRAGLPEDYINRHLDLEYDENASCPRWLDFLHQIFHNDEKTVKFIHRALGYSLTGSVKEEVVFILTGEGSNGKTKFLETVSHILGDYACTVPSSAFQKSSAGGVPNDVAMLDGRRLATCSETNDDTVIDEAKLQQLTGGDTLTARYMRQDYFSFTPSHKIWLATNHLPSTRNTTYAFWRRIVLLKFTATFVLHDEIGAPDTPKDALPADDQLKWKLQQEAQGILAWMVRGAALWFEQGLAVPNEVRMARSEHQASQDVFKRFINEMMDVTHDADDEVQASLLQQSFKRWFEGEGLPEKARPSEVSFGKWLKRSYEHRRDRSTQAIYYQGLRFAELETASHAGNSREDIADDIPF